MSRQVAKALIALSACWVISAAFAVEVEPYDVPDVDPRDDFQDFFAQVADNVFVTGQPNQAGLEDMRESGVVKVINLRTQQEMNNRKVVPFDEAQAVQKLGMQYVHIPLGGPGAPYSPAGLKEFADAIESAEGPVLLHCTVAWRASHMWAAYLVAHQGFSVGDAVAVGKKMNMGGYPFAEFLDRDVSLEPKTDG